MQKRKDMKTTPLLKLKKIQTDFPVKEISCPKDAYEFIKQFYADDIEIFESFFLLCLNNSKNTTGYAKISQGGITGTVVDVRLVAKYAIENLSTSVIIAHNHPAGTLRPSQADIQITSKIKEGLRLLDVSVVDHIILTENGYYSFLDEGML